jgi:hypothetical protein
MSTTVLIIDHTYIWGKARAGYPSPGDEMSLLARRRKRGDEETIDLTKQNK